MDLGLRIRLAGYRCLFVPTAQVFHVGHGSDLPHERYIFLIARNRIFLFLKNIPFILIAKHLVSLIYGWLFYFFAFSFSRAYLKGTLASFKYVSPMLKERKHIRKHTKLSLDGIDHALSRDWPEISLGQLSCQWLRHFVSHKK